MGSLPSTIAVPWNIFGFFNPADSATVFILDRVRFDQTGTDLSGNVPGTMTAITRLFLYRASVVAGGVDRSSLIEKLAPIGDDSEALIVTRDAVGEAAITATLAQVLRFSLLIPHGWAAQELLFPELRLLELQPGQGIVFRAENAALRGGDGYFPLLEWREQD